MRPLRRVSTSSTDLKRSRADAPKRISRSWTRSGPSTASAARPLFRRTTIEPASPTCGDQASDPAHVSDVCRAVHHLRGRAAERSTTGLAVPATLSVVSGGPAGAAPVDAGNVWSRPDAALRRLSDVILVYRPRARDVCCTRLVHAETVSDLSGDRPALATATYKPGPSLGGGRGVPRNLLTVREDGGARFPLCAPDIKE